MKRNKLIYDRWLRTLFLSFALLVGGSGWMTWGQEPESINLEFSKEHDNVHTEEKIIYVDPEKPRVLSIPVLNTNTKGSNNNNKSKYDNSYNWFVHWYVKNGNNFVPDRIKHHSITVTKTEASNRGSSLGICNTNNKNEYQTHDYFISVTKTKGLIWSNRLKDEKVIKEQPNGELASYTDTYPDEQNKYKYGLGIDASTIAYTLPKNYEDGDIVYCDVSIYQDGEWNNANKTYTEPTLLKRYKYVIQKADKCPSYKQETTSYDVDFPQDAPAINVSMPYTPDNYFWLADGKVHQGSEFEYRINSESDDAFKKFHLTTKNAELKMQQTQRIEIKDDLKNKDLKIDIRAICNEATPHKSGVIATFIFRPITNAKFMLESEFEHIDKQNHDRWPRGDSTKYKQIGHVSFDQALEDELPTKIVTGDNMSDSPLGVFNQSETTYGFIYKNGQSLLDIGDKSYTTYPGMYGLFRSANADISKNNNLCSTETNVNRYYKWLTNQIDDAQYKEQKFKDSKLFDRTYSVTSENGEGKYGYFYYVDATDEPGTLVSVPIDGFICENTELTVTGWLADMTRPGCDVWTAGLPFPLAPNLNVIFKGKSEKGEDVVLHRFTTGDALTDYTGTNELIPPKWSEAEKDTEKNNPNKNKYNKNLMQWQQFHYKFVVSAEKLQGCTKFYLEVQNNEPHTDGADYAIDDIRIFKRKPEIEIVQAGDLCDTDLKTVKYATSYSNIMRVMGLTDGKKVEGINKDVEWDDTLPEELKKYISKTYSGAEKDAVEYFTKIYYSVYEEGKLDNPISIDYDGDGKKELYRVSYLSTRIKDMSWVDPSIDDAGKNSADKIYSLPLHIGKSFDPKKKYIARISTQPIDASNAKCDDCALTGDPFSISVTGDRFTIFEGDDLKTEISSPENAKQGETYKIVGNFRYLDNGTWTTLENAKFDWFIGDTLEFNTTKVTVAGETYTIAEALKLSSTDQDKSNDIKTALTNYGGEYKKDNTSGKFVFGASSFEYTMANKYQTIIGLPQAQQKDSEGNAIDNNLYCPAPVVIQLGPTPPTIDPGDPDVPDPKDPEDPEDPDPKDPDNPDQPDDLGGKHVRSVRIGLVQIQDMQANNGTLRIPIHMRKSEKDETFAKDTKTNITVLKTSHKNFDTSKAVATLEELVDKATTAAWATNYFKIKFTQDAVNNFKEGFWYMVDIPYAVKDGKGSNTYTSSFQLTLKIVPEYVTWVGSEESMHNWNNDGLKHWRRSNNSELYISGNNTEAEANGTHNEAYTPMRFTKVTIADNNGKAYAAYPHLYQLSKRTTEPKALLNMAPANMDATIGAATKNIEYDLLADPDYERELFGSVTNPDKASSIHNYSCVRFYGNTCNEIYIKPESEILHTEFLTYNTAHVDYEMDPNRWYMLASPLKGVVSGDMYLPTGTSTVGKYARQETPAFGEINYDNTNYTRWKPAVYMRGWDKAMATVVRPGGSTKVNYGIKGSWSNLYNDVDVPFTPGTGFSIGTKTNNTNKVLFRLPKADNEYTYYGSTIGSGDKATLTHRTGNGRFYISPDDKGQNTVTSCLVSSTGGMFGNPFMSHLDMAKFLNGKSTNTYYIMTATGTTAHILGDEYSISTGDTDPKYVAPLQSFIVKDLASATFTTDMIAKAPATGKPGLRSATSSPADEPLPQLRITATRDGVRNTAVVAGLITASDSYVEGEDAALLINEEVSAPQVYTLAGNQMTAINVTPELAEIPVGIHSKNATPVELSFKVSGAMQNVTLVDKQAGKSYPVTDKLTLTVPGNTSGRYFLNGSIATSNEIVAQNRIIFYSGTKGRIDISSTDPLTKITVYNISGRQIRVLNQINAPVAAIEYLQPGIYVVKAESITQIAAEKVEVK
ncbi:T9SS type A sorting domain-containing protein [Parabacteroides gordonii]|jgi:hypothetical protein|uniref:T9SS type A sorting domain-containing protein n=1 Tax=Parabacteroides gordonii TaxID=574930 RepID=UPI00241FFAFE|nr:T9SS type A sorting domain-containing protein [Parabacteroides gordonii]